MLNQNNTAFIYKAFLINPYDDEEISIILKKNFSDEFSLIIENLNKELFSI